MRGVSEDVLGRDRDDQNDAARARIFSVWVNDRALVEKEPATGMHREHKGEGEGEGMGEGGEHTHPRQTRYLSNS